MDPRVDAAGRDIAARLGLKGPFKIDLIRDARTSALYTLEINARYTLWHYLGAASGVNLPLIAYELLVHRRRPERPLRPAPRHRWLNLYADWLAFREQRQGGGIRLGAWIKSVARPATVYEAFAWEDPGPFAWWIGNAVVQKVKHGALRDRVGHPR
jgi:predicted ATP-grasp superfamily ATP-dependent carboligase